MKTQVASVNITGHNRTFRAYIEMRALCEAYTKARAVSGKLFSTGSSDYWAEMRTKVENNKRSEFRKSNEREVRQRLATIFNELPVKGFSPYIKYLVEANERALKYRRDLDAMIQEEMEYAQRNEKLFGILGQAAVIVKLRADITLAILGTIAPFVGSLLVALGYSGAQDAVKTVEASKNTDVWVFQDTKQTFLLTVGAEGLKKGMELDKGAQKVLGVPLVIGSIVSALTSASEDWKKFQ